MRIAPARCETDVNGFAEANQMIQECNQPVVDLFGADQ